MCIGHRYCHQDVTGLGFQNFDELFDLSYDVESQSTRLWSAIERNLPRLRREIDLDAVQEKINANFEWLMGGYSESIRQRAERDLAVLFEKRF